MTASLPFTTAEDSVVAEIHAVGAPWRAIGERLSRSHFGFRRRWVERLRHQDSRMTLQPVVGSRQAKPVPSGKVLRRPMDAGDPVSWGAITVGTLLAGCAYRTGAR